jgi:cytochrome c oxidase cbb3-type subunit 4
MNYGLIHSVWTVMMLALFIGIIVWAWSARRKKQFDEAARLPLEDDDAAPTRRSGEKNHG